MQPLIFRKVPAHDGIHLATDVYLPDGPGALPVVSGWLAEKKSGYTQPRTDPPLGLRTAACDS